MMRPDDERGSGTILMPDVPEKDDECPHGLGPKSACTLCNGRAAREAKVCSVGGSTFPAQHRLFCRDCDEWWEPGSLIGRLSTGRYVCAMCWFDYEDSEGDDS